MSTTCSPYIRNSQLSSLTRDMCKDFLHRSESKNIGNLSLISRLLPFAFTIQKLSSGCDFFKCFTSSSLPSLYCPGEHILQICRRIISHYIRNWFSTQLGDILKILQWFLLRILGEGADPLYQPLGEWHHYIFVTFQNVIGLNSPFLYLSVLKNRNSGQIWEHLSFP